MSTIQTILDRIAGRSAERHKANWADYREVVQNLAAGQTPPDLDAIVSLLRNVASNPEQLRADVETYLERQRLAALAASGDGIPEQIATLQAEMDAKAKELDELRSKNVAFIMDARERRGVLERAKVEADNAKRKLLDTCTDPDLLSQRDRIKELQRQAVEKAGNLENAISRASDSVKIAEQHVKECKDEEQKKECESQAERSRQRVAEFQAQHDDVRAEIRSLGEQERAVRDAMTNP